jgi:hypothetical protein
MNYHVVLLVEHAWNGDTYGSLHSFESPEAASDCIEAARAEYGDRLSYTLIVGYRAREA